MGIFEYVQKAKRTAQYHYNAAKSRKAFYDTHPEARLRELKDEQKRLQLKEEIRNVKRQNFQKRVEAITSFIGKPTIAKAQATKKGTKSKVRAVGFSPEPSSAFGIGSSSENYNMNRPSVFGMGGKVNPAFGLGPEKKRRM